MLSRNNTFERDFLLMCKRILCVLLCLFLLSASVSCAETLGKYDHCVAFDLSFSLDADSFPLFSRRRISGYEELLDLLRLKGTLYWNHKLRSVDLNASVFYVDKPDVSFSFRIYGTEERLCLTSPLLNGETLFFNMVALMEFAYKAQSFMGINLPILALLYPYTTTSALSGLLESWKDNSGNKAISAANLKSIASLWEQTLQEDQYLNIWISSLAESSSSPETVEEELKSLPSYLTGPLSNGKGLTRTLGKDKRNRTWKNAKGKVLYTQVATDTSLERTWTLPATEGGYLPYLYLFEEEADNLSSLRVNASVAKENPEQPADTLLDFSADCQGFPTALPMDSDFSAVCAVAGDLLPNYGFILSGQTKKDGTLAVSVSKMNEDPESGEGVFRCEGTLQPCEPESIQKFKGKFYEGAFSVFSFNEDKLGTFVSRVTRSLLLGLIRFVAEAPTSACQSFLDDLTDLGVLDMILE